MYINETNNLFYINELIRENLLKLHNCLAEIYKIF